MSEPTFKPASNYALTFIFVTMLVDTIGLGIIIPVTPADHRAIDGSGTERMRHAGAAG